MIAGIILSAVALTWIIVEGIENHHSCDYNCSRCSQYSCPYAKRK